jgi:GTP cyclohydrolase II
MDLLKIGPFRLPSKLPSGSVENFDLYYYTYKGDPYYVLIKGERDKKQAPLVRIHSACSFGNVFHSQRCDCGEQFDTALEYIAKEGGILIYAWNHEGRSVGFENHVRVYMKQDEGFDTYDSYLKLGLPVDQRDYSGCVKILENLGVTTVRLLTNNPRKLDGLTKCGLTVERVPLTVKLNHFNESQLTIKKEKLGHLYES